MHNIMLIDNLHRRSGEEFMKTNRRLAALGVLSLIMTIMTALAFASEPPGSGGAELKPEAQVAAIEEDAAAETEITASEPVNTEKRYILKNVSGFIGIFEAEDPEVPKMVTGIVVSKLRAADAEMLSGGILVNGEDELARLLEDFGS